MIAIYVVNGRYYWMFWDALEYSDECGCPVEEWEARDGIPFKKIS